MPSHASKAEAAMAKDRAKLTLVPDPQPDTALAQAQAEAVARLPQYQQDEYARLVKAGSRHAAALADAKKLPDPAAKATSQSDAEQMASKLFASMNAMRGGGATAPPVTVAAAAGRGPESDSAAPPTPEPVKPRPKPAAASPRPPAPKPAPRPKPAPVPVDPGSTDRWIGTVTATDLSGKETVYDCQHGATNGHMDISAAETCARRLLRNHPTGTTGHRLHPVKRDRNGRKIA